MSKESFIGGDYIETTGGSVKVYAKGNIENYSAKHFAQKGDESGVVYAKAEKPEKCKKGEIKVGKKLIGQAKRLPGYNFDGTVAEDMLFNDKPTKSKSIMQDPVYKKNDATLGAYLDQLMTSLSIGKMETVALEMSARFQKGTGGTYKSNILNNEIANHGAFVSYHNEFLEKFRKELESNNYDPNKIAPISMGLLNFSSFWDKVSGLGITIHQVWSIKAELIEYKYNKCTKVWSGNLLYTLYDHFGLDWDDIIKHGKDRIPQYHTGDFFKAWYILQHYRNAKPFITEMTRKVFIAGYSK